MGLDTSVYLRLYNKKDGNFIDVSVAYWRKYFSLTIIMLQIARRSSNWAREDAESGYDYETTCYPSVLTDWIEEITELLKDREADEWTNSIWEDYRARGYTARQLEGVLLAESICAAGITEDTLDIYKELFDDETREWLLKRENPFTDEFIDEILQNANSYEWLVVFENSY